MAKVLLIFPPLAQNVWNYSPDVPLGLALISTYLKGKGHQTSGIDLNVTKYSKMKLKKKILIFNPDYIAISCTYGALDNAIGIAQMAKDVINAKVILGGLPATFISQEIHRRGSGIDIYVHGEGEKAIAEIVEGKAYCDIQSISYVDDDKNLVRNDPGAYIENLDILGVPDRDLFPLKKYRGKFKMYGSTIIETSRGCPYYCDFCIQTPKEGRKVRLRSPEMVHRELLDIARYSFIRDVGIVDNDFLAHKNNSSHILELLESSQLNKRFDFHLATRADRLVRGGDKLLNRLKSANVKSVFIGIESVSEKNKKEIGKILDNDEVFSLINDYAKAGIDIFSSYIIGYPGEEELDIQVTLDYACKLNTKNMNVGILTPYPGTKFYERQRKENKISNFNFSDYDNIHKISKHDIDLEGQLVRFRRQYFLRWSYLRTHKSFRRSLTLAYFIYCEFKWFWRKKVKISGKNNLAA